MHPVTVISWAIAIILLVRWLKSLPKPTQRTGRIYENRVEWD